MSGNADIIYFDDDHGIPGLTDKYQDRIAEYNPLKVLPSELSSQLAAANLLIVDYFLVENQTDPAGSSNGLSELMKWRPRPVAALVSGHLESALQEPIIPERRHVLAARSGVEWIADKNDPETADELLAIADASAQIRKVRSEADDAPFEESLKRTLGLPQVSLEWSTTAERHLDRARPPHLHMQGSTLRADSATAAAREIISWLLHKVLPYPSFLINSRHVALRLGVEHKWLIGQIESKTNSQLINVLKDAEYKGVLAIFEGKRWWRAAIDHFVWSCSNSTEAYRTVLRNAALPTEPEFLSAENPVIVSDADLVETNNIAEASDCVRAQDESFPPDVPPAWVKIVDALGDSDLCEKVLFEDRPVLSQLRGEHR